MKKGKDYNVAQAYQDYARYVERLSDRYNSMDKDVPDYKIKTHADVSIAYNMAAEKWEKAHEYEKAIKDYRIASKFAYNKKIRETLSNRIKLLEKNLRRGTQKQSMDLEDLISLFFGRKLAYLVFAFFAFFLSVSSLSINLTGNIISGFKNINPNIFGVLLFSCGLLFVFLFLKKK
ncbi:hypothetical protein M0R19_00160 [Candidatus Pacearchaeota archaeon]|jgi:hypothetical protein|nr:hypothetical protein [Candidatus Pacearchaeota archaeon]